MNYFHHSQHNQANHNETGGQMMILPSVLSCLKDFSEEKKEIFIETAHVYDFRECKRTQLLEKIKTEIAIHL